MPQLEQVDTFVSQIFWLFVSFAIIYYFISRIASPKIGDVMRKRQNVISGDLEKASEYKDEALKITEKFEAEIVKRKYESLTIMNSAHAEAEKQYTEQIAINDNELKRSIASSEIEIKKEKEKVLSDLSSEISTYVEEVV